MTNRYTSKLLGWPLVALLMATTTVGCSDDETRQLPSAISPRDHTQADRISQHTVQLDAGSGTIWNYLTDYANLSEYVPGVLTVETDNSMAQSPNGVGAVRTVRLAQPDGSSVELTERIVIFEPGAALGYAIGDDNPLGMVDHLGLIQLTAADGGTALSWSQYYGHPDLDAFAAGVTQSMDQVAINLTDRFGGEVTSD